MTQPPSTGSGAIARPTNCPKCNGRIIETLAKVISPTTMWRCRECEATWTIESLAAESRATNRR